MLISLGFTTFPGVEWYISLVLILNPLQESHASRRYQLPLQRDCIHRDMYPIAATILLMSFMLVLP